MKTAKLFSRLSLVVYGTYCIKIRNHSALANTHTRRIKNVENIRNSYNFCDSVSKTKILYYEEYLAQMKGKQEYIIN